MTILQLESKTIQDRFLKTPELWPELESPPTGERNARLCHGRVRFVRRRNDGLSHSVKLTFLTFLQWNRTRIFSKADLEGKDGSIELPGLKELS